MVGFLAVSVYFFSDRDVIVGRQLVGLRNTTGSIQCGRIIGDVWNVTDEVKLLSRTSSEGLTSNRLDIVLPDGIPADVAVCLVQAFNETIIGVTPLLAGDDYPVDPYTTVFLHGTVESSERVEK